MPTYEYECAACGLRFERSQKIRDDPVSECPECRGSVRRLLSSGTAFVIKGAGESSSRQGGRDCSLEQAGRTCCGREERCGKPSCGGES
ncbi:MAG: zinc ribbon domain-containing protein [Anaerolineales bacterium]|nr:zinc ribbon domain-containing protein [Anaerolineales bacterium]